MEKVKLSSGLNKILSSKSTNEQDKGLNYRKIPAFWDESNSNGFVAELEKYLGVCMNFDNQQEVLTYFICAEKNIQNMPIGREEKVIPASTWAVFGAVGSIPSAIENVWERIFSEWFPYRVC